MTSAMDDTERLARGSPERFGYSWHRYADIISTHEEQFRRWTAPLTPEFWRGKRFLDGGCGVGRNSFWPMCYGATGGVAIDVDPRTLARARTNLAQYPAMEVRQQSIYEIAEADEFDVAFSIGVVHHLQDPLAATRRLVRAVRPGGHVFLWLYGRENNEWIVRWFDPIRIALFSRLPLWFVHALSWPLTALLWIGLRLRFRPNEYFRLISGFSFNHLRAIVFDHMLPKIALYYTRDDAIRLLRDAGLENVQADWVNENSWAVHGTKPAA